MGKVAQIVRMPAHLPVCDAPVLMSVRKSAGQAFDVGEVLFEYSFDGALIEERACEAGVVLSVVASEGKTVDFGLPVMIVECEN